MEISAEQEFRTEVENVRVAVRCRPLNGQEQRQGHCSVVQIDPTLKSILVCHPENQNEPLKSYIFDEVFGPDSNQLTVYNTLARPIVDNVLRGFNGTIFAYGQTGTGKTYTMSGGGAQAHQGVIQYSFAHIFDHIAKSGHEKRFLVHISFMEIYNEEVRDLLARHSSSAIGHQPHRSLEIKERPDIGVYVKDLLNVTVASADQCLRIMQFGNSNRHTGMTSMNEQSSRSHAIFTITVECSETVIDGRQLLTQGKLHLVDLAGSERQSKTNAVGERLKEASKINLSLSTLGNVISALVDAHSPHIPYRNSKLTRILQDSLGGNSKTAMIANIGPASYNYDETISTLRYASRAKNIRNIARINEDPKDALLRRFQEEIEQLRRQLEENADIGSDGEEYGAPIEDHHPADDLGSHNVEFHNQQRRDSDLTRIRQLEEAIELDKRKLEEEHGMKEAERSKLVEDLQKRQDELRKNKHEREKLVQKLSAIERQIIVGGENMLEKAEMQARLLEESNSDLEKARLDELTLQERFRSQQAEHLDIEEQYNSLQEEAQGLNKKLKKVWIQYMQAKGELRDQEMEHQRTTEALLENIRQLQRELLYSMLVLDQFIPDEQQKYIEQFVHWDEQVGDWQLKCIAYAGNNIREENPVNSGTNYKNLDPQMKPLFLSYTDLFGASTSLPPHRQHQQNRGGNSQQNARTGSSSSSTSSIPQQKQQHNFRPKSAARDRDAARIRALLE